MFTPGTRWLALFAVGAAFALPAEGFGVDVCALHRFTGLPCPGCGLTRGFVLLAQGDVGPALGANPFTLVLFPLFVLLAALALAPEGMHRRVLGWVGRKERAFASAYRVGVAAFLGFGGLRLTWFLLNGETFP